MNFARWLAIPLLLALPAWAEDTATPTVPDAVPASEPAVSDPAATVEASGDGDDPTPVIKKTRKGRRGGREKEAEGTQAPNRFEADTVIKSQYQLDGQPLEVDPD